MSASHPRFSADDPLLAGPVHATLDLHGMDAAAARAAVERFVRAGGRSGKVVLIVTGKGKGSPGRPVLRGMVRGMLKGSLAPWVADWALDQGEGGYRVKLR